MLSFTLNKLQFLTNKIFNLREEIQEDGEQQIILIKMIFRCNL